MAKDAIIETAIGHNVRGWENTMASWNYVGILICAVEEEIVLKLSDERIIHLKCSARFWHHPELKQDAKTNEMLAKLKRTELKQQEIEVTIEDGIAIDYKEIHQKSGLDDTTY